MFGEDESDVLRAPSPWDGFLSTTPSEVGSLESNKAIRNTVPKLAPEVEEGNVEYKLKLTDISPARFARLVTQLKWRLLEGSGQAYYELGVADSGALIGLSRTDLEESLETLEMMAGEIGASVIVVKEIEVPSAMVAFADKVSAYIDPETGKWTEKMSNKRFRNGPRGDSTPALTETDADLTDTEDGLSLLATPEYPPYDRADTALSPVSRRLIASNPERPTAQSSPFIAPLDDDLALFSMEPEPEFVDDSTEEEKDEGDSPGPDVPLADIPYFPLDIEISAVFKPRPFRRRQNHAPGAGVFGGKQGRKGAKPKDRKASRWDTDNVELGLQVPNKQEAKALHRRLARDKRREARRKALVDLAEAGADGDADAHADAVLPVNDAEVDQLKLADDASDLALGLESLHVHVQSAKVVVDEAPTPSVPTLAAAPPTGSSPNSEAKEPRLIVEALVVRKMSIEEGFLDFGGFSLI